MINFRGCIVAGTVAGLLVANPQSLPAQADDVADFYKGKTVIMVVGSDAGGGYDIYARLLSRYLGKYIPGNPSMIVQNRSGAGSITATNYVYNVAPQDGTVILAPNRTAPFAQILGQQGPRYEATKLNWLGSLNNEVGVLEVSRSVPVKTVEDARRMQVIVGSTTVGTDGDTYPSLMNNTLGTKFKIVRGYSGSAAIDLAIERGEVQAQSDSFSSMAKHYPDWREKLNVLVQFSLTKHPQLGDIPLIFDYLKPEFLKPGMKLEDADALWRIMLIQKAMGRPFATGPNVPPDRVKALRDAFKAVLGDDEFKADAEKMKSEINPVQGVEIQALLEKINSSPRSVIDKLNDAITYKGDAATANEGPPKP
jgi:tripartite-type tricarboxylate transporter receptor subunit TctC